MRLLMLLVLGYSMSAGSAAGASAAVPTKEAAGVITGICPDKPDFISDPGPRPLGDITIAKVWGDGTRPEQFPEPQSRRDGNREVRTWVLDWSESGEFRAICEYEGLIGVEIGVIPPEARTCVWEAVEKGRKRNVSFYCKR
ncbi:MAG TPA: hypothetical protein VED40_20080 [Azospirillaceae bacterium]|nr:hypothetical protein [Azospirillaceae bacterium]